MPNDRLRDALLRLGLTATDLAEELRVDAKTVERWITLDRIPYPRHRHRVAARVRERESYLWPTAVSDQRAADIARSEVVHVYPHRANIPTDLWRNLLDGVERCVEMLVYSALFLPEQHPRLNEVLREKARNGVSVRILLGDPDSRAVAERGRDEGIGDAIASKIRNVLVHYKPLRNAAGVDVRLHSTALYNSLYRFDDDLFVNTHVYGLPAGHSPALHLRRLSAGELFDTYAGGFERVWERSTPAWPDGG